MTQDLSPSFARLERLLRWSAAAVLIFGLGASVLIWRAQDRIDRRGQGSDPEITVSPLDDRRQIQQLEVIGGKAGVMVEEAKGLFHGKGLAKTVAVVSVVTAAGLFLVSVRWPD